MFHPKKYSEAGDFADGERMVEVADAVKGIVPGCSDAGGALPRGAEALQFLGGWWVEACPDCLRHRGGRTWMAGTSPAMTGSGANSVRSPRSSKIVRDRLVRGRGPGRRGHAGQSSGVWGRTAPAGPGRARPPEARGAHGPYPFARRSDKRRAVPAFATVEECV